MCGDGWYGDSVVGVPPRVMGIGPAYAIPAVLKHVGLSKEDVDLFEVSFSPSPSRLNPHLNDISTRSMKPSLRCTSSA